MAASKLYGVELDSITGRIAQQLYPRADITVAGFETTDRRDFYDLRMSVTTSVPALARKALLGKRMAPRRSARSARYFRASSL